MEYAMTFFTYPTVFVTVFMIFIMFILICGLLDGLAYLYFVTFMHSPKLVTDVDAGTSVYYEYNRALKKYVRNDLAVYDKNDPKIYKIDIMDHFMSF